MTETPTKPDATDDGEAQRVEGDQNDEGRFGIPTIEELELDEVRRLWQDLTDGGTRVFSNDELADFTGDLWRAIRTRTDVEQPPCPECGGTRYTQSVGDPLLCIGCSAEIGYIDAELSETVHNNWQTMISCDDMEVRGDAAELVETVLSEVNGDV